MQNLEWTTPTKYMLSAKDDEETTWYIKSSTDVSEVSRSPKIVDYMKLRERVFTPEEEEAYTEEYQRHYHRMGIGSKDFGYAESIIEAKQLIDRIRAGDAGLPPALDQLLAAGFKQTYPERTDELKDIYSFQIKRGELDVTICDKPGNRYMHARYEPYGSTSWHNVARVTSETPSFDGSKTIYYQTIPNVTDIVRIGVAHVISVMQQRLARTGKERFSTPLGGSLPRIKY